MINKLPKSFHISKRKELLNKTNADLIVLAANGQIQMSLDQSYDFVQESNFYYLTGLNIADLILVLSKDESFLILPKINHYMEVFDGGLDLKEIKNISGITKLYAHEEGIQKLKELVLKNKEVHTLFEEDEKLKTYGITSLPFRSNLIKLIKQLNKKIKLIDVERNLAKMRMIKSEEEIHLIARASKIIKESIEELDLLKLKNTKEVALEIERLMVKKGASSWAFKPVISTSRASTVIHYVDLDQDLKKGNLLLVDVGCKFEGYSSDISRTLAIGRTSKRYEEVVLALKEIQKDLIKYLKPGISFRELEDKCEELIGLKLIALELIKKANNKSIRKYYPHAVTHHLGIDTHDLADYSQVLTENMVITIEPGIYIEKEEIGVRFEDDVLITSNGAKVL
jgi:Xaa-Pro aminopeptidase